MNNFCGKFGFRSALLGLAVLLAAEGSLVGVAEAQSCQDLWVERNSYFKDAGYCFNTSRGISYFGNAGCSYDNEGDVPLSRSERARVSEIKRIESRNGCNY